MLAVVDHTFIQCNPQCILESTSKAASRKMTKVKIDDYSLKRSFQVISDTGTSLIAAPSAIAFAIARKAGGKFDQQQGLFFVDCKATPSLELTIGEKNYVIGPENFIVHVGDGRCIVSIFGYPSPSFGPSWILGDPFIREYCNIYDGSYH
ncbi:hypothetical protein NECAME_06158 [Necator americanus]|uniref:Peptidase A1 domain-containing protein n=1 Tax=Necator americanus TaxID=51031 RepID=W2TVS2_NECAM|nr:hypothetical protein NECAME_06158 [Necator americanus]ETN85913.1 hypothetical protein NECAME_06158 [Necator americanus]